MLLAFAAILAVWFGSAMYVVAIAECKLDPLVYFFGSNADARRCPKRGALAATAAHAHPPKWFVLRQHQTGYCWVESLGSLDDAYRPTFAQTAGGPFAHQEQALERLDGLRGLAACQRD